MSPLRNADGNGIKATSTNITGPLSPMAQKGTPSALNKENLMPRTANRRTFRNQTAVTYLPGGNKSPTVYGFPKSPAPAPSLEEIEARDKLSESLISLGDLCEELRATPADAIGVPVDGRLSVVIEADDGRSSSLSHYDGFESVLDSFKAGTQGRSTPPVPEVLSVDMHRAKMAGSITSDVNKINVQVTGVPPATITTKDVSFAQVARGQKNVASVRMINEQARGPSPGEQTNVDFHSVTIQQQVNAPKVDTVNEQIKCSDRPFVKIDSVHVQGEMQVQNYVADLKRVNEQCNPHAGIGTIPSDSVENVRTAYNQANTANVRMVNEQIRGEHAGERTLYSTDGVQIETEMSAQSATHAYRRVNEQARGELAGVKTEFNYDARELQRQMTQQKAAVEQKIVNEQVNRAAGVGNIPADSVENIRAATGQQQLFDVRQVNEQVRGETAGMQTTYGADAAQMKQEIQSGKYYASIVRINEEARGEFAGQKTRVDSTDIGIRRAAEAPKVDTVNTQIKHVGRGHVGNDGFEFVHAKSRSSQHANHKATKKAALASSAKYGAGDIAFKHVAEVPRIAAVNSTVRGENAGKKTGYGGDSVEAVHIKQAPKIGVTNPQVRTGYVSHDTVADAKATETTEEWVPESHRIIASPIKVATPVKIVTPQRPPSPEWSKNAAMFGLKKVTKPGQLETPPKQSISGGTPMSPLTPGAPSFAEVLRRFR